MANFRNDLRRAFGWSWILAVLIVWAAMIVANLTTLGLVFTERVDSAGVIYNAFFKGSILPLSLLAVACPFATSYWRDVKSGYIKYQIARTGRRRYTLSRFFSSTVASATAIVFAQLSFCAFCLICYPYPDVGYYMPIPQREALGDMYAFAPFTYFMILIGIGTLSSMAWSGLALALSGYIRNEYISICIPFLLVTLITALSGSGPFFEEIFYACGFIYDAGVDDALWSGRLTVYILFFDSMLIVSYLLFRRKVRCYHGQA